MSWCLVLYLSGSRAQLRRYYAPFDSPRVYKKSSAGFPGCGGVKRVK